AAGPGRARWAACEVPLSADNRPRDREGGGGLSRTAAQPVPAPAAEPLLRVEGLIKHFPVRGGVLNTVQGHVHAVNGVSLIVRRGETVGVVGESGCGKS